MTPQTTSAASVSSAVSPASGGAALPTPRTSRGVKHNPKPVEYKGVWYPTQRALARAIGVHYATVSYAVRLGRLDTLGTGAKTGAALVGQSRCQPVASCGWWWPSQKAAAAALGVNDSTLGGRLDRGTLDALVMQRLGVKV